MATVYFPNSNGLTLQSYGYSGCTYTIRFAVTETAHTATTSTYTLKLQCKNNADQAWWSGTAESAQPKLYLYVNGSKISFVCPGGSSSTTGYFRTASQAYTASTAWKDIGTATGLTVTNTPANPASITIGMSSEKGTGDYSGPYGIATCGADSNIMTTSSGNTTISSITKFKSMYTANVANGAFSAPTSSLKIKVSGSWVSGTPFVKVSGQWKQGIVWVNVGGTWKTL